MTIDQQLEKYRRPHTYVERLGVNVGNFLEKLTEEPARPLTPEERETFDHLESGIVEGRYETESGETATADIEVGEWYKKSDTTAIDFLLDYFQTPAGVEDLNALEADFGIESQGSDDQSLVSIARRLARCVDRIGSDKRLKERAAVLAKKTHTARVEELKARVYAGQETTDDPEHVKLQAQPENVVASIEKVLAYRRFLREVRADLPMRADLTDNVRDALLVEVDIFRQRATEILGEMYPKFVDIYKQAILLDDMARTSELLSDLEEVNRPLFHVSEELLQMEQEESEEETVSDTEHDLRLRFALTMDKWRNGHVKGEIDTPFSEEILLLESALDKLEDVEIEASGEAVFSAEEIAYLDSLEFDANDIAAMVEHFLARNNLLSTATVDDFAEGEWPSDSTAEHPKIGIAIGTYQNLMYNHGWIKIPSKTKRQVRQMTPAGAALVVPHELEHAIDGITSEYGERQVKATRTGTRLAMGVREGIGKRAENDASMHLFGQPLKPSLSYLKAMRSLMSGQGETQAVLRFAEQAADQEGNPDMAGYIMNAENRVQRLIDFGGRNSRALFYLEQELIKREMNNFPERVNQVVSANSYLDLQTQVRLHEFGLLTNERFRPEVSPIQAVEEYLRTLLQERK
jgi:hypothetical protein